MNSASRSVLAEHDWARETIPWLVNGTLADADARRLRAHIESCDECRTDLQLEERLAQQLLARPTVDYAPQASLARMLKRIDRPAPFSPRRWFSGRFSGGGEGRRGVATFVITVQAAAVLLLTLALSWSVLKPESERPYGLAGGTAPSLPHLQIIFEGKVDAAEILGIVARVQGRVIGGPSSAGVYLVEIEGGGDAVNSAARVLGDDPRVSFVAVVQAPSGR